MFKVEREAEWGDIEEIASCHSLDDALQIVRREVLEGHNPNMIKIWQEIPLDFTLSVQVKAK